jgi:NarL family two-component system response regulator LiaR
MSQPNPTRVIIVDDHDMVRSGLAVFLEAFEDLVLVGEASDGVEAVRLCTEAQPHVVLMDLVMPRMDGIAATRAIRKSHPDIQVIALTSFHNRDLVLGALQAGAVGYLLKSASIDELAEAIRSARKGRPSLAPEALRILVSATYQQDLPGHDLTDREREVLALLAEGLNNPDIAQRLTVGLSTVKTHVSNILSKLGVSNRMEAAALALEHNLVKGRRIDSSD